jgi:hypothetical protein
MIDKLSHNQMREIFSDASLALRALNNENAELKEKLAFYQKRERVEKIASEMERKGLDPDTSYEEKINGLMDQGNLDVIEKAVNLQAKQIKVAFGLPLQSSSNPLP